MKSSSPIKPVITTLIAAGLSLFTTMASAYTIVNNTGVPAFFAADFCAGCKKRVIPAGGSLSTPADKVNEHGFDIWVYGFQGRFPNANNSGPNGYPCYARPTQKISVHDTIIFSKNRWEIFSGTDKSYASGQYIYSVASPVWRDVDNCPGYFQEG